ncbi:peptidoglycan DD-metalloendopeptidase family protein [Pedobacter sp. HMF7056]|uniref:Peptidoglycan DD-metalloendopeptidase family protein n=2 Tax=Hufsiella ginkgonis TaxID=2695274 RepID=A0A7K1XT67_9SPHI|nr:peptidoglycan DD-metalloendopeptidase family protein [Hufsiella ginkgonis]
MWLKDYLDNNAGQICPVVDFDPGDRLLPLDFTGAAAGPDAATVADPPVFAAWIEDKLAETGCRYGIGGYAENRTLYQSKALFGNGGEPRSLHLGTDIWGPAGTPIYCPMDATVHSFANNDNFGDYGGTVILQHHTGDRLFYTLYGHLSVSSLTGLSEGMLIRSGTPFATLGAINENGHWPPHLHFQLMLDMQGRKGDYPGVCRMSEQDLWLKNCKDPGWVLRYTF